jgi:hypothetical protein
LSDLKPELEQFAMDPWRTQSGVSTFHPPDQHAQLCLDLRSSAQGATSNASSRESRPCANARAFGLERGASGLRSAGSRASERVIFAGRSEADDKRIIYHELGHGIVSRIVSAAPTGGLCCDPLEGFGGLC